MVFGQYFLTRSVLQAIKPVAKTLLFISVAFFCAVLQAEEQIPAPPVAESSVMELLERMSSANREQNYQGIFTYEHGGVLKTVEVTHTVRDGQEYEKLVHLNGPRRELIRHGRRLDCQRVGDMLMLGMGAELEGMVYSGLEDYYSIYIKDEGRVADRQVVNVHLVPKDKYRYGYILSIDKASGLLLQTLLVDRTGKGRRVLERFQFVQLELNALLNEADIMPSSSEHVVASADGLPCMNQAQPRASERQWQAAWLPPGFAFAGYQPRTEKTGESLIYTDGLAVFSVFVDSASVVSLPEIEARRGATFAYLVRKGVDDRQFVICVVGEIPPAVAKQVAHAVMPLQ